MKTLAVAVLFASLLASIPCLSGCVGQTQEQRENSFMLLNMLVNMENAKMGAAQSHGTMCTTTVNSVFCY
jgi:hypothetical protein